MNEIAYQIKARLVSNKKFIKYKNTDRKNKLEKIIANQCATTREYLKTNTHAHNTKSDVHLTFYFGFDWPVCYTKGAYHSGSDKILLNITWRV